MIWVVWEQSEYQGAEPLASFADTLARAVRRFPGDGQAARPAPPPGQRRAGAIYYARELWVVLPGGMPYIVVKGGSHGS